MKTLSFREFQVGRTRGKPLLTLDGSVQLGSGLHLVVAPNGHGKTTLFQTIAGVLPALGGEAQLDGKILRAGADILYVSEYLAFPKFIYPGEWVEFMAGRSWGHLQGELKPWIEGLRLGAKMGSFLGRMSQGERRKTTWLAAHASSKPILLLDEPLDGLDLLAIDAARALIKSWRESGRIVCVVAHQVGELIDLADEVWLIRSGKLLRWNDAISDGKPAQKLESSLFREKVLRFYSESLS